MARGLSRELSQQKNVKNAAKSNKGNTEDLTATQRAERDAKVMQEKAAAKEEAKEEEEAKREMHVKQARESARENETEEEKQDRMAREFEADWNEMDEVDCD